MTAAQLDPLTLGLVLAVLGMGGTLLTLYVLSLIMSLLTRLFPEVTGDRGQGTEARAASPHPSSLPEGEGAGPAPRSPTPGPQ